MRLLPAALLAAALVLVPASPAFAGTDEGGGETATAVTQATTPAPVGRVDEVVDQDPDPTSSADPDPTSSADPEPTSSSDPAPTSSADPEPTSSAVVDPPASGTDTPAPTSGDPATTTPAPTTVTPPPAKDYQNCTELRVDYPLGVGHDHPAYQDKLDRDNDGWACDPSEGRNGHHGHHVDWKHRGHHDSDPGDNDWRKVTVNVHVDGHDGKDGKDGSDGKDGEDGTTTVITDSGVTDHTQWPTVPSGGIQTGDGSA